MRNRPSVILLIAAALMLAASCGEDPQATAIEEDGIQWPDMTSRDDVIKVVVLCYENPRDAESEAQYSAILHSQYFFMLHDSDVLSGESPIISRSEEILLAEELFETHTILELTVTETGSWSERNDLEGGACENCWETRRQYFIRTQFGDDATIYQSYTDGAFVQIIVAPDENDSSRWVLRAMYDLGI